MGVSLQKKEKIRKTELVLYKKFYSCYRSEKIDYGLSWTHYRLLLSISEKRERKTFEKHALAED